MARDCGAYLLDDRQHGARPAQAVDPDDVGAGVGERTAGAWDVVRIVQLVAVAEGEGNDRGLARGHDHLERGHRLGEPAEGLADDEVAAGLDRPADLLLEYRARRLVGRAEQFTLDI